MWCPIFIGLVVVFASGARAQSTVVTIVDLSHELHEDIPIHPAHTALTRNITRFGTLEEHGYSFQSEIICQSTHLSTHIDAPRHFNSTAWAMTDIPLERLVLVPAAVVDITHKVFPMFRNGSSEDPGRSSRAVEPDAQLTIDDLEQWEATNGRIPDNSLILMHTGWDRYWGDQATYLGGSESNNLRHPGMSPKAAQWLVRERPTIYGIGVDVVSLDYGRSLDYQAHQAVCSANMYILENLTNLDRLPATGALVNVGCIKIGRGASGAPSRVVATVYGSK